MGVAERRKLEFNSLGYEVRFFAHRHRLTIDVARDIIRRIGSDRERLVAEAKAYHQKLSGDHIASDRRCAKS